VLAVAVTALVSAAPMTGFSAAVERLLLERTGGPATAQVDPLLRTIVLTGARPAAKQKSQLCPDVEARRGGVALRCTSRRLAAAVTQTAQGTFLDLRLLRGVARGPLADAVPLKPWALEDLGVREACPGTSDFAKAECLLGQGRVDEAAPLYTAALKGRDVLLARVRLGDVALHRGDADGALSWFTSVKAAGSTRRLADLRACDLTGNCLQLPLPTVAALPASFELEASLHVLRYELSLERDKQAMERLVGLLDARQPVCQRSRRFCQKAVTAALASDDGEAVMLALSVFTAARLGEGVEGVEVSRAAATAAETAGAPAFAAAVLAATSARLPAVELDLHLQRVARLYLAAGDTVRAGTVVEYAAQKLPPSASRTRAWRALTEAVEGPDAGPAGAPRTIAAQLPHLTESVESARELARATLVRALASAPPPPASPSPGETP
jgi:hypothetical protein